LVQIKHASAFYINRKETENSTPKAQIEKQNRISLNVEIEIEIEFI
jgi:hypothetical protein